jgi:hypothetical protein
MARSPRSPSADPSLNHRLQWHAAQQLRRGIPCSVLVLQPLALAGQHAARGAPPATAALEDTTSPLASVAARLRPLLRQLDIVEVEEEVAVGVLLPGADADGVRAVHQRLCRALDEGAEPCRSGDKLHALRLAVGHASAVATDGAPIAALARETVCVAYVPRLTLAVPLPAVVGGRHLSRTTASEVWPARPLRTRARMRLLPAEIGIGAAAEARDALRRHADALRVPYISLPPHLPSRLSRVITGQLARELRAVPIGRTRGILTVAMQDPTNIAAMQRLAAATGLTIFPVLAAEGELDRALDQLAVELSGCAPAAEPVLV